MFLLINYNDILKLMASLCQSTIKEDRYIINCTGPSERFAACLAINCHEIVITTSITRVVNVNTHVKFFSFKVQWCCAPDTICGIRFSSKHTTHATPAPSCIPAFIILSLPLQIMTAVLAHKVPFRTPLFTPCWTFAIDSGRNVNRVIKLDCLKKGRLA